MGDFVEDTALVALTDGTFQRVLSRDWTIWGPNGGYLVALALRAAGEHCGRPRPANVTAHFLGVADFDQPVELAPVTLRQSRSATSVAVAVTQAGKPILHALVWAIDADLDGLHHDHHSMPDVESWSALATKDERFARAGIEPVSISPFWSNFDERPTEWIDDWENRGELDPDYQQWMRFRPRTTFDDPWVEAGALALLVDLGGWPAASRSHVDNRFVAPSIDVSCEFHRLGTASEWMFLNGVSPHAGDGLVASHQQVWNDRGELLASGISHLLCRSIR